MARESQAPGLERARIPSGVLALAPEASVAQAGTREAVKFWGGLVDALGKPAVQTVTVKVGRKVVYRERHALGVVSVEDRRGARPIHSESVSVPRWVVLPVVFASAVVALSTAQGAAALGRGRALLPGLPSLPLFGGGQGAPQTNALGIPFTGNFPGGGVNPLNYLP